MLVWRRPGERIGRCRVGSEGQRRVEAGARGLSQAPSPRTNLAAGRISRGIPNSIAGKSGPRIRDPISRGHLLLVVVVELLHAIRQDSCSYSY